MKKLFLFVFTITLFISCSDSSNLPIVTAEDSDLAGTWKLKSFDFDIETKTTVLGNTVKATSKGYGKDYNFSFYFKEAPKDFTTQGSFTIVTTTTTNGISQTIEHKTTAIPELSSGKWRIENNELIVSNNGKEARITIETLEKNKMVLNQKIDRTQIVQGIEAKVTGANTLVFEK